MGSGGQCPAFLARVLKRLPASSQHLLVPCTHPKLVTYHRAALIISRVRMIAALFAVLTPLWIILDVVYFPPDIWLRLAAGRVLVSSGFVLVYMLFRQSDSIWSAYLALALLFFVPSLFFLYSYAIFSFAGNSVVDVSVSMVTGYAFLPFVMATGLSVFPLTIFEGVVFAIPALFVELMTGLFGHNVLIEGSHLGLVWLFVLIAAVAVMAGMAQLHYLYEIIMKSSHDQLTGAFNRDTGEELLEKYYVMAERAGTPLTLIFLDLDNFKTINDHFGHDKGDETLFRMARTLAGATRREDLLIRWGGEEFLLVMPNAVENSLQSLSERLFEKGFGLRPEGWPLTASMGVADLQRDRPTSLAELIDMADKRMYRAKAGGKNAICFGEGKDDCYAEVIKGSA